MSISMKKVCNFFNRRRQAFYKRLKYETSDLVDEQTILEAVKMIRRSQPRVGTRKLLLHLKEQGFNIGRDRLYDLLRRNRLLVKRKKRGPHTTYSKHWMKKYANLIWGTERTASNQVFVSDITYLRLPDKFAYLSLVTDAFSRKIVGWDLSLSLSAQGAAKALKMALKDVVHTEGLIHHSDRGIQYCCADYIKILKKHQVLISMTEDNHCYENAIAERINGILKGEFLLGETLPSFKFANELVKRSILTYNTERKHMSLMYQTPQSVHQKL
jgi:transposase InsO family protein